VVVAAGAVPVGRDEVAAALGIGRTLAAFHLDKLVDRGLLEVSYARRSGRSGPGAGRPAKLYRRSAAEHVVSVPPRAYRSAAELLAEAVEETGVDAAVYAAARSRGTATGAATDRGADVLEVLSRQGYEPVRDGARVRLLNCPFHLLAEQFPALVCGMNLALLDGVLAGAGWPDWRARLDPGSGRCCVVFELSRDVAGRAEEAVGPSKDNKD
jgi:predicted ArsR family transcriptional regulator